MWLVANRPSTMFRFLFLFLAITVTSTSACTCITPGVQCTRDCAPTFCLCDESLHGVVMNTSVGTRCLNGSLVHESLCSGPRPECESDGFYCTSPCSVSYSYCVSGRRTPAQFVPAGTVCDAGALVYPTQCASLNTTAIASCPTYNASIQCDSPCSPSFYYCVQYATYAVQMAPTGLKCYNNTFVLASDPVCAPAGPIQTFPIVVDTQDWSVLTQYGLASALSTALAQAGARIQPVAIYFPSVSTEGRRLASQQWMSVYSSYANLSTALAVALTELPAILAANNLAVTMWLQPPSSSASPSASAKPNEGPSPLLVSGIVAYSVSIVTCVVLFISVIMI